MPSESPAVNLEEGSEFDHGYRTLMWAVDVLAGDNPQSDSILEHGFIDADARKTELPPPALFAEREALAAAKTTEERAAVLRRLNDQFGLLDLPGVLIEMLEQAAEIVIGEDRKAVLIRSIDQAAVRLESSFAGVVEGVSKPSFEEMWGVVTGDEEPPSLTSFDPEILALRAHMMALLARSGVHVTNPRTLRKNLESWEAQQLEWGGKGSNQEKEIEAHIRREVDGFVTLVKAFLRKHVPALVPYLDHVHPEALRVIVHPDMPFDAGLTYIGGAANGTPTGAATYEWNAGRPANRADIRYIATHEATHWLNALFMDFQRRAGRLGHEAALLTMGSGLSMNEEGLAQTFYEMLYGGSLEGVIQECGLEVAIVMLQDQLQDIARLYASIGFNRDFAHIENPEQRCALLRQLIQEKLLQTVHIAEKYAGDKRTFWRQTPAGLALSAAYPYGSRAYRNALLHHDVGKVLAVGMHTEGLVDFQSFQEKLRRKEQQGSA